MPQFNILFDVRYTNGCASIRADTPAEAERKFSALSIGELLQLCSGTEVDIEEVEEEE